jgi:DNA-binding FadR family transcriptional regulator
MKNEIRNQTRSMKPVRAFEEVSSKIKEMIFKGVMKPGDRLPSEVELASRFQVGRQSVREALRILELSGFISVQKEGRSSGAIIQDTILKTVSDRFVDALVFEKLSLDHLTIARLEIEKRVVYYAINNACEQDCLALEENIARAREKIARNEPATEENILFHQLLPSIACPSFGKSGFCNRNRRSAYGSEGLSQSALFGSIAKK